MKRNMSLRVETLEQRLAPSGGIVPAAFDAVLAGNSAVGPCAVQKVREGLPGAQGHRHAPGIDESVVVAIIAVRPGAGDGPTASAPAGYVTVSTPDHWH